eukprot:6213362-Pleurochrysis_carterae.AAC.1
MHARTLNGEEKATEGTSGRAVLKSLGGGGGLKRGYVHARQRPRLHAMRRLSPVTLACSMWHGIARFCRCREAPLLLVGTVPPCDQFTSASTIHHNQLAP